MNWLYVDRSPITYIQPREKTLPRDIFGPAGLFNPRAWPDLHEFVQRLDRTILFFDSHDLFSEIKELNHNQVEVVFLFSSCPKDYEIHRLKQWVADYPQQVKIALPTRDSFTIRPVLLTLSTTVLNCVYFYSVEPEVTGSEYFHFQNFLKNEQPKIESLMKERGADYRFFCLPKAWRMLADEVDSPNDLMNEFKLFETRMMYKIFLAGRNPPAELHKELKLNFSRQAFQEVALIESLFHVPIQPGKRFNIVSSGLKFQLENAADKFYSSKQKNSDRRGALPYAVLAGVLFLHCLAVFYGKMKGTLIHSFWIFWAPVRNVWGKIWWRPGTYLRRVWGKIWWRPGAYLRRVWGQIWWRPSTYLRRVWGEIWWRPRTLLRKAWGEIWWRPNIILHRAIGRIRAIWGNYWWRPVAHFRGFLGRIMALWSFIWRIPSIYIKRTLGCFARVWGKIWWRPTVVVRRWLGNLARMWGQIWWRPSVVVRRWLGHLGWMWGQVWWRPNVVFRRWLGNFIWMWGQIWWRPAVAIQRAWAMNYWKPKAFVQRVAWKFATWFHMLSLEIAKVLRWSSFPIRKIYYFSRYQYQKRIQGFIEGSR